MNKNFVSKKNSQFDRYIKIGIIGEYDVSPTLREKHSQYMLEYRTCLMAICDYTHKFEDEDVTKATVWCYVYATILERFKNPPNQVLQYIKELIESKNLEFQNTSSIISKYKPVNHCCPECNKVILIPPDYKHHNFRCLKCDEKLRSEGR